MRESTLLLTLAGVQFCHILDFMIIMPLGKQFMEIFGINPEQFSHIVAVYAFTAFVVGILGAGFIDRFDRKHVLTFAFFGFLLGTLACAFASDYWTFLGARALTGAFGGTLGSLVLSIIGDEIPYARRGKAMGIVMTAFSVASVAGVPLGVYLAATYSWRMPFYLVVGIGLVIGIIILFRLPSMRTHLSIDTLRPTPLQVLGNIFRDKNQATALLFTMVMMLGHFSIIPFIAPYMQLNIGFSDQQVSLIYLIGGLLTVVLLPLVGSLSDRYGHINVFTIASLAAVFSILFITNLPAWGIIIGLLATSSFFVVSSGRSVPALAMVTSVVHPETRGSFMSVRTSINELALGLSSFIAGLIVIKLPDDSLGNYHLVGYFAIVMTLTAIWLGRQLKAVDTE